MHMCMRTHKHTATQYDPFPTLTQFLQKASQQQVHGVKISFVSLRKGTLIGCKWEHVIGVSQLREWRTMRIELPASLLLLCELRVCCVWYVYQQWKCQCKKVRTLGKHLCLQDQRNVLLNVRSAAHRCESTPSLSRARTHTCTRTVTIQRLHLNRIKFLLSPPLPPPPLSLSQLPVCLEQKSRIPFYTIYVNPNGAERKIKDLSRR